MSRNPAKTTLMGLFLGLWIAATATIIIMIKQGADASLQAVSAFITDFPTLLFIERLGLPGDLQIEVLFVYCAVAGAFLGWLAGMARTIFWTLFVIAFATVIVSHWLPDMVLEQGLLPAFDSLAHDFIGANARGL